MMDKGFMQLNEDQLKEISGGAFDPNELMKIKDSNEAKAYMTSCGLQPGQGFYESYFEVWKRMNGY